MLGVTPKNEPLETQSIYLEKACEPAILHIMPDEPKVTILSTSEKKFHLLAKMSHICSKPTNLSVDFYILD